MAYIAFSRIYNAASYLTGRVPPVLCLTRLTITSIGRILSFPQAQADESKGAGRATTMVNSPYMAHIFVGIRFKATSHLIQSIVFYMQFVVAFVSSSFEGSYCSLYRYILHLHLKAYFIIILLNGWAGRKKERKKSDVIPPFIPFLLAEPPHPSLVLFRIGIRYLDIQGSWDRMWCS